MRTLEFDITNGILKRSLGCDFSNILSGICRNYLQLRFHMDRDFSMLTSVVVFICSDGVERAAPIINGVAEVPQEALPGNMKMKIIGMSNDNVYIETNILEVMTL